MKTSDGNGNGWGDNPTHVAYQEFVCPDGYVSTKVPLKAIRYIDALELERRIMTSDMERYGRYKWMVEQGIRPAGVPVVYRTPKGNMFASDIGDSDLIIHAELKAKHDPRVPRNTIHPLLSVKIIEVSSREDIPVQRARYLEAHQ